MLIVMAAETDGSGVIDAVKPALRDTPVALTRAEGESANELDAVAQPVELWLAVEFTVDEERSVLVTEALADTVAQGLALRLNTAEFDVVEVTDGKTVVDVHLDASGETLGDDETEMDPDEDKLARDVEDVDRVDVLTDETDALDETEAHGEELVDRNSDFELENELIVDADKEELEDTESDDV